MEPPDTEHNTASDHSGDAEFASYTELREARQAALTYKTRFQVAAVCAASSTGIALINTILFVSCSFGLFGSQTQHRSHMPDQPRSISQIEQIGCAQRQPSTNASKLIRVANVANRYHAESLRWETCARISQNDERRSDYINAASYESLASDIEDNYDHNKAYASRDRIRHLITIAYQLGLRGDLASEAREILAQTNHATDPESAEISAPIGPTRPPIAVPNPR